MGRAEINADQIAGRAGSRDDLVLPVRLVSEKNIHHLPDSHGPDAVPGMHSTASFSFLSRLRARGVNGYIQ